MFEYDVFLSYSSNDKSIVHALAECLKRDGLRVWLDEWIIQPGDSIPLKIQQGLEKSSTLLMCMSPDYFGSEWGRLEHQSILFRDPTNTSRRLIPLLIAECTRPDIVAHLAYIDWRTCSDEAYNKILTSCQEKEDLKNLAIVDGLRLENVQNNNKTLKNDINNQKEEERYKLALVSNPNDAGIHHNYGMFLRKMGRMLEAEKQYKLALAINPFDSDTHNCYGFFLNQMERNQEAEEHYKLALANGLYDVTTHFNYGCFLKKMGRIQEAEKQYKLVLEIDPKHIQTRCNYGSLLKQIGRNKEAEEQYRLALAINPNDVNTNCNYGTLLMQTGRMKEAEEHYKRALKTDPIHAITHNNYGLLLNNLGRKREAKEHFKYRFS